MKTKVLFVVAAIMSCVSVMAQWSKDASTLLYFSEDAFDNKVEMGLTPQGSVWFAVQSVSAETATTVLTMVDSEGNRLFEELEHRIVVSNYPSRTELSVGKTLYVDSEGNAIVAVSDQRKGVSGSEGYTVYKISPEGEFLWGEDGISLDGENVYSLVAGMSICQLDDGSYVFAWMHTHESDDTLYTIEMQRISGDGEMLWNAMDVRLHEDNEFYSYPYVVDGGNNQVIMLYAKGTSQDLYARKIDFDGTVVWSEDTRIYNGGWGSVPVWTVLDVHPSGDGGLIVSWNDDRNSTEIESAYMAYVKSDGEIGFTSENGQMLGYAGLRSLDVSSYYDDTSDSFYAIWRESSAGQSSNRVVAQRISKEGELLWGENGLEIEKMNNNYSYSDFSIQSTDDNEIAFFYLQNSNSTAEVASKVRTVHASDTTFRRGSCISKDAGYIDNLLSTPAYNDNWLVSWIGETPQLIIQGVSCELPRLSIGDKFTVDGIHYEVLNESGQVAVTYYGEDEWNVPEEYKYAGEVVIPETVSYQGATYSVTSIGDYAFDNCEGLTSITIPNSVASIGYDALSTCSGLTSIVVEEDNTVYDSREDCNAIIETATNTLVAGCKNTVIPNSVTSIGNDAFNSCDGLTSITIPSSVTSIGNWAFYNCHGLTEITIPESVTSIGAWAFSGCSGLTEITIPNSVTEIGIRAFSFNNGLTSIKVEEGNTVYDSRENCNAIILTASNTLIAGCKNTIIPNTVTTIDAYTFEGCDDLTSITIPNSVTSIGYCAFLYCSGLTEITIPESVTSIGDWAFSHCVGLTSITIPESVTFVSTQAFECCSGLTSIKVEDDNTVYDSRGNCNAIIETATNTLIAGCKNTVIPNSVISIGSNAFSYHDLTSITIPESVTSIGDYAFSYCYGLTSIRIEAVNPPAIEESTFKYIDKTIPVYVPTQECVEAYRNAEYWSEFTNIQVYIGLVVGNKFTVDGIHYEVLKESGQVAVTYYGEDAWNVPEEYKYAGTVVIPESVTYKGVTYSVTSIGDYAFRGCDGLTSITIPNSVTSIGDDAFRGCDGLTSITIPERVTSIGYYAFCDCDGLTEITIPNSVTSIGDYAFSSCYSLTSITIPNNVTSIGDYAFNNCDGLTEITIPNSVTSIGYYPFRNCDGLTSMVVEDGNIVYDSRENCNAIIETATNTLVAGCKKTIIPNSVTSIGYYAFYECTGLTSITIPESVTSIGDYAFRGCYGLTEITIPESVTSIGDNAFGACSGLTSIKVEEGNTVYDSREGCNAIIETATNTLVAGCKKTIIPNSVTSIGDYAFRGCYGLTEITIPNSVTSIGDYAFCDCYNLTSIRIEAVNPPAIEENTFSGIDKTIPVYVPTQECVEAYRNAEYWSEFTNIQVYIGLVVGNKFTVDGIHYEVLKESGQVAVTYYGEDAWNVPEEYKYADTVVIPESVTYEGVTYSVTSIGYYPFRNCNGLTSVTIPSSVTSIGDYAFCDCNGLTEITIPNSVTSIGYYPFLNCNGLTSMVVEDGNTVYDSREGCNAIIETATNTLVAGCKKTIIPNSVTSIGNYAFSGCYGLTSITIPNSVTSIGFQAFNNCVDLTEITIPNSVTSIGNYAFDNCNGLTSIRIEAVNPPAIEESTFRGIDKTIPVYVPTQEFVEAYRNAEYWSEFTNIQVYIGLVVGNKFTVDGIHYEVLNESGQVAVTYYGEDGWNVPEEYKYAGEVVIPETVSYQGATYSVTSIGDDAFVNCHGLTEITIPESVTSIGDCAFYNCHGLTSITIPNSVTSIGNTAFSYCDGLTSMVVEEGNTVYDSREGCNAIIETATNTLVAGCKKTIIPNSVTSIGYHAFYECTGLTSITIPESVTSIGYCAFSDCTGLTTITIPESVTSIGQSAFSSCTSLTSITIPNSVTEIDVNAFGACSGLTSIKVEEGNTVYDSREGCNAIIETATNTLVAGCKKTIIPNSVTSIGDCAFYNCHGLTEITIPSSVTSIGDYAFTGCSGLTEITIPNSITSIGNEAFLYCRSLTSIRIEAVNPPAIEESTFNYIDKTISVYVPTQECVEAYRNAGYWSEFTNIQSYTETLTYDVVVPAGTWECYIIGEFNQMSEFVPMTKINDTHYTITIEDVERSMHYQYACGNGPEYVEAGDVRTYNENDVVEGWTNMPAVEAGEPEANRLQSGGVTVSRLYDVLSTARVPMVVELINEAAISALQCDIYLPEGLSVATVENGLDVTMGNRGSQDHTIDARTLDNGAIRVLVMSGTAAPLTGNAGALFTIGVIPNENYTEDAQIVICNIVMTDTDIVEYNPKQIFADCHIKESVLGDANSDGRVNVTDIVLLAKYILGGYNGNIDVLAADINQDSRINVSDIVALANLILSGKGAAGAPARQEGVQGTLSMDHVLLNTNAPTIAPMMLDNTVAYTAFQMDVIVPEGLCIEDVVCGERLTAAHNLMWKEQADGSVRIIAFATDNTPIKESQGELFHLVLSAEDGFADGEIYVSDAIFVTRGMLTHQVNDIVAGVSAPTGIEAMYSNNRVYAAHRTIVIETTCEQPAYITTIDGVSQSIDLQPGRNVLQVSQQGVYIVTVGNENKKVVVK